MKSEEFEKMTIELKEGNTHTFDRFFKAEYKRMVHITKNQLNCSYEEAEPYVSQAFTIFWENLLKDRVTFQSPVSYILKIARNCFLKEKKQKPYFSKMLDVDQMERILTEKSKLPLIEAEIAAEAKIRALKIRDTWAKLSENCRALMQSILYKGLRLKTLGKELGYSSDNTTKNTFLRCKKKFRELFKGK